MPLDIELDFKMKFLPILVFANTITNKNKITTLRSSPNPEKTEWDTFYSIQKRIRNQKSNNMWTKSYDIK